MRTTVVDWINREPSANELEPKLRKVKNIGNFTAADTTTICPGSGQVYLVPKLASHSFVCVFTGFGTAPELKEAATETSSLTSAHENTVAILAVLGPHNCALSLSKAAAPLDCEADDWKLPV